MRCGQRAGRRAGRRAAARSVLAALAPAWAQWPKAKKLKTARVQGLQVLELKRKVLVLKGELVPARAATLPPGGFEKERLSFRRGSSRRGRPFDQFFFSEAVAPAMLTTGAAGVQITEILRLYDLRYHEPGEGPSESPEPDWW